MGFKIEQTTFVDVPPPDTITMNYYGTVIKPDFEINQIVVIGGVKYRVLELGLTRHSNFWSPHYELEVKLKIVGYS